MKTKRIVVAHQRRSNQTASTDYSGDDNWKITKAQDADLYSFEWRDHPQAPWKVVVSYVKPIDLYNRVRVHFASKAGEDAEQVDLRADIGNALLRTIYGNAKGHFTGMKAANSGPSLEERLNAELAAGQITTTRVDQIKRTVAKRKRETFNRIARERSQTQPNT
ncbi:hypothetical protein [Ruegeria sp. HKCCD6119]|uniref:hypothetical protein n=1 Tax=Ruegeria sp. HKCCD6119 TaxID=2683003 RepID=UPI0014912CBD|nr:hypothetical protein [Ruegeria sp. HKCCD6119]NOD83752.1 hypothetical protein [Ruegeria sp. HKCCD6119]